MEKRRQTGVVFHTHHRVGRRGKLQYRQEMHCQFPNCFPDDREESEESRRLAPQVVEGLIAGGLCRLAVPASLGGHETEPKVVLEILEELAAADASVAWIVWINQFVGLASRYSSEAVRAEIFNDARRLFAGSTRPSGKAVSVEGGFRVSGQWSLVSGCEFADWIPVTCVVI